MNWAKKILLKLAWPKIKNSILGYIKSEEYQKKYIDLINNKINIPNLDESAEAKLLNQIYDATQVALTEIIENVDLDKII